MVRQWWRIRRDEPDRNDRRGPSGSHNHDGSVAGEPAENAEPAPYPYIRDAERRALDRLLRRRQDLSYDLRRAESAMRPENSWTERIEQLDNAIEQARDDRANLRPPASEQVEVHLPATPIAISVSREPGSEGEGLSDPDSPAVVRLRAGTVELVYREEIDWAERGHQLAQPQLALASGNPADLAPAELQGDTRDRFVEHLRQSCSIIAGEALESESAGQPTPSYTLADLSRGCERCGGWLDPKGRCPACLALDYQRRELRDEVERLRDERQALLGEMQNFRERLPIIRRQLAETEADIAKLEAKGVEPE